MHYSDHDQGLLVWGVATKSTDGRLRVHAHRSGERAEAAAERAPALTITGWNQATGTWQTVHDVSPLAYCHAEIGWTLAAIGWPISAHTPDDLAV